MAKVSLRIYNREIEGLIDQGHTDEAIAHCHHILKTFPKHLETYRLLGKAHLEAKHYNEAVDIFSRVLMAVPEDFVAHVGMSIIRDEQNKLDDAIWHMERAFEAQPSNAAIQVELQRLYGRRDGNEPPKIRMTRGALAYVYVQGELYPQAIAEIRAVLSQDPNRGDMKVLIARAYFRSGQKADASDMCAQLLKQYPYCFDANRIMVELLPATAGAAESTQVYRARVFELDPYATFTKGSVFQSGEVADAAINLERLEYTGNEVPIGKEWSSSLGIGLDTPSIPANAVDAQPDWLTSPDSAFQSAPQSASETKDEIPDFLRAAGWGESKTPEQPTSYFDQEPAAADNLVPADLPDWLKGQAPITEPVRTVQPQASDVIETPDWLSGLGEEAQPVEESTPSQSTDIKDWLSGLDDAQEVKVTPPQSADADLPDWLGGLGNNVANSEPAQPGNIPDWLSGSAEPKPAQPAPAQADENIDIPDWLGGLGGIAAVGAVQASEPAPAQPANVPDWLSNLDDAKPDETAPAQPANVPEWLAGLDQEKSAEAAQPANVPDWLSNPNEPKNTEAEAPEWLNSLSAAKSTEPELEPAQPATLPDWLSGLDEPKTENLEPAQPANIPDWLNNLDSVQAVKSEAEKPVEAPEWLNEQPKASVESLGASTQEQDDAVAWLESLAAKHGAKPEELVTDPSKRSDVAPEWVQQAQNINQQTTAQPSVESLGSSAQEQDDAVAWLESLAAKHGAKPEELVTDPSKRSDVAPEWVQQAQAAGEAEKQEAQSEPSARVEGALNIGEQFFAEFENSSAGIPATDETGMWLRNLDEKENQNITPPSAEAVQNAPDWLKDLESEPEQSAEPKLEPAEIPGWLQDAQPPAESNDAVKFAEDEPVAQNGELPNWLNGIEEESAAKDAVGEHGLPNQDLSDWLSGLDDEPGLPFDAMPTPNQIVVDSVPRPEVPIKQESVPEPQSDLPAWLSGVDAGPQDDLEEDLWKQSVDVSQPVGEPAAVTEKSDLPEWLQGVEEEAVQVEEEVLDGEDAPPWLHRERWEAEGEPPVQLTPASPSDWHPLEAKESVLEPAQRAEEPVIQKPVIEQPAPSRKRVAAAKQSQPESVSDVLAQAKGELDRGDIPTALNHYGKLIKKGKHLEETIRDLNESLYRYPVEVGIWQTLGDAYMRSNRLKEALEAYNKAEELIR